MKFRNLFLNEKVKKKNTITQCDRFKQNKKDDCQLRTKIISMLNGNWKKTDELIGRARFGDSGKSYSYYCYKAIVSLKKNKVG